MHLVGVLDVTVHMRPFLFHRLVFTVRLRSRCFFRALCFVGELWVLFLCGTQHLRSLLSWQRVCLQVAQDRRSGKHSSWATQCGYIAEVSREGQTPRACLKTGHIRLPLAPAAHSSSTSTWSSEKPIHHETSSSGVHTGKRSVSCPCSNSTYSCSLGRHSSVPTSKRRVVFEVHSSRCRLYSGNHAQRASSPFRSTCSLHATKMLLHHRKLAIVQ